MAWIAAVSLEVIADPAELFKKVANASFEGARMVTFFAIDNCVSSSGNRETYEVRLVKSGEDISAAVRFMVCADAPAASAASERCLKCILKLFQNCESCELR